MRVKIGDFGLAKLAGSDLCTHTGRDLFYQFMSGKMGQPIKGDSSESRFAIDLWEFGCITHKLLTQAPPFPTLREWNSYRTGCDFSRKNLLSKNISLKGIKFIESTLALLPENQITAKQALDSERLQTLL